MHGATKDTGKYQHFLYNPFANGALEHNAIFTLIYSNFLHTALLHCKGFLELFFRIMGGIVRAFGNGIESLLLVHQ